jgi:chorismate--pyruvate lyase
LSRLSPLCNVLEPRWRGLAAGRPVGVPPWLYPWLAERGSLTRRVIAACPGHFQVFVLGQDWGRALASERRVLGLKPNGLALIREVELQCDGEPWVYARTVIPAASLKGRVRRLTLLGDQPLGARLFADPTTVRGPLEVARFDHRHALYQAASGHREAPPAQLWGRRAQFSYQGKPLLVNEVFLPDIPAFPV